MEIVLVRHSITASNLERRFTGLSDIPIIEEGAALSREISPTLPKVDKVYVSPLLRCRQTAELLWPNGEEMVVVDDLREMDFGPFEGLTHEDLKDNPNYLQWLKDGDFTEGLGGGEPIAKVVTRMVAAVGKIIEDAKQNGYQRVGIMTHGGTIMALMTTVGAPKRNSFYDWKPQNSSGWLLEVTEGSPYTLTVLEPLGRNRG